MNIASIGIDRGKTTFHLVALGERNKILLRRKFSRAQLLTYTANLPASLIGLEACAGAHFMGAALREQGHQVRLIPAQFVKPYRKSNKNDFIDAEAIAEAVTKQNMRFVQIKTQEQLDWQAMHRVRSKSRWWHHPESRSGRTSVGPETIGGGCRRCAAASRATAAARAVCDALHACAPAPPIPLPATPASPRCSSARSRARPAVSPENAARSDRNTSPG
jgi:hypothetical protein